MLFPMHCSYLFQRMYYTQEIVFILLISGPALANKGDIINVAEQGKPWI